MDGAARRSTRDPGLVDVSEPRLLGSPRRGATRARRPTHPRPHRGTRGAVPAHHRRVGRVRSGVGVEASRWRDTRGSEHRRGLLGRRRVVRDTRRRRQHHLYVRKHRTPEGAGAYSRRPRPPYLQPHVPLWRRQRLGDVHGDAVLLGWGSHHGFTCGDSSRRNAYHAAGVRRRRSPGAHRGAPRNHHPRMAAAGQDAGRASGLRPPRPELRSYAPACPRWFRPTDDQRVRMRWA